MSGLIDRAERRGILERLPSETDGRARFAPHTAFRDPTVGEDVEPRQSIEIRTLVFHAA